MDLQYDVYSHVRNAFDADKSITRASGTELGPGNQHCFGPCEMASSRRASAILGKKKSRFPRPNLVPHALVMDLPASEELCTEPYQSEVHR
jgi:hypothetical protein